MLPIFKPRLGNHTIHAIGLGAEGVRLAAVQRAPGTDPVLKACEYVPVSSPDQWPAVLSGLRKKYRLDRNTCSLLLGQEEYSLLLVEAPQVPPEEVRSAVRWRIQDLIDFHIDDAVIDVFDLPQQAGRAGAGMMYVVASRTDALQQRSRLLQDCGLNLQVIDVEELASRNLAAELPEDAAGVALLRTESTRGLITLTKQGELYLARRLDLGYEVLGAAAAGGTRLEGFSAQDPQVSAWLDRLLVEVQRSLDYFESNFRAPPIDHLVMVPPPFEIAGLTEEMAARSGLSVRLLEVDGLLDGDAAHAADTDGEPDPRLACLPVIGAALRHEALSL